LPGRLGAVRLLAGVGDRDGDGRGRADRHRGRAAVAVAAVHRIDGGQGLMVALQPGTRRIVASPAAWLVWGAVAFFMINLAGVVGSVLVSSFGTRWFGTWLPEGFTTDWYADAWRSFGLLDVVIVTLQVSLLVVVISVLIGVPASYVLARRDFPGKKLVYFAF